MPEAFDAIGLETLRRNGVIRVLRLLAATLLTLALSGPALAQTAADAAIPRYDHIFVIVEENKDYAEIVEGTFAPNFVALARHYGNATRFYSEVHPSQANYIALLGGDTFGIHDDDAFYCKPGDARPFCYGAAKPGYVDHTIQAPHLGDQLAAAGLHWKGYYEDLPEPGSEAIFAGANGRPVVNPLAGLYAAKHSGFMNFASVQSAPDRAALIVGFDQLDADLASGDLPNFALVLPNQCNEMHGLYFPGMPDDCSAIGSKALIRRGDAQIGRLVAKLQASSAWKSRGNMAIVITFDEDDKGRRDSCCGVAANLGGGRIPTIVITNHGPRGVADDTPYSHYSLLRTLEDAFGVHQHLGHAADSDRGVVPMNRLFQQSGPFDRLAQKLKAALTGR
jgi:hypothetical protein